MKMGSKQEPEEVTKIRVRDGGRSRFREEEKRSKAWLCAPCMTHLFLTPYRSNKNGTRDEEPGSGQGGQSGRAGIR